MALFSFAPQLLRNPRMEHGSSKTPARIQPRVGYTLLRSFSGACTITDLIQVIYASQPFGYDEAMLAGILLDARKHNLRNGITGALVCRHDIYLQLLEGPAEQVNATVARIERDDRHVNLNVLLSEAIDTRMFGEWAMLHDPAKTVIWSDMEIADGIMDRVLPAEIKAVFASLSAQMTNGTLPNT